MTLPRSKIIDRHRPTWVHCTSRCVRRAFLAGDGFAHRKAWIEERLAYVARHFAVEVAGYAVMSNHLHVIVRMDAAAAGTWSDEDVARRWLSVYPRDYAADGTPIMPIDEVVRSYANNPAWVHARRTRLAELGWFMKALKEPIARRANREDGCTGAFWEGRFHSVPLLDQSALIACMAYVDLNPIRAKITDRPETSDFTGGLQRIAARQRHRAATALQDQTSSASAALLTQHDLQSNAAHPEAGLWLCPLARCTVGEVLGNRRLSADDYLIMLDATGRLLKAGKRGAIPPELAPILARLDIQVEDWLETMVGWRQMRGAALGHHTSRISEAARRGMKWVKNHCALFAGKVA